MRAEHVDVDHAMMHLPELLARVERGEKLVIARAGRPVARLSPVVSAHADLRFLPLPGLTADALLSPMRQEQLAEWE